MLRAPFVCVLVCVCAAAYGDVYRTCAKYLIARYSCNVVLRARMQLAALFHNPFRFRGGHV